MRRKILWIQLLATVSTAMIIQINCVHAGEQTKQQRRKERACRRDQDCVFKPRSGCGCEPCGPTHRSAVNKKYARWLMREYAKEKCPRVKCARCRHPVTWLEQSVACLKDLCTAVAKKTPKRSTVPKDTCYRDCLESKAVVAMSWEAIEDQCRQSCNKMARAFGPAPAADSGATDRACKKNSDCEIQWKPCGYRQPPCGDVWRTSVNRKANKRSRAHWANKKPVCNTPRPCKVPGRWLGTRSICVKGTCVTQ